MDLIRHLAIKHFKCDCKLEYQNNRVEVTLQVDSNMTNLEFVYAKEIFYNSLLDMGFVHLASILTILRG